MSTRGDRAIVITGASTGIGASCALRLDRLGFTVFAGVRKPEDGAVLQQSSSDRLMPILLDVTDLPSIQRSRAIVSERCGASGLYGLVNNAGIAVPAPLEAIPLADFRRQLEVNVIGQLAVTQAFLPLIRQARGRIVNMGSIAGRSTIPMMGAYSASKFALEAMTDALRLEVQPWGIQVSIIEPGAITTPIWTKSAEDAAGREAVMGTDLRRLYEPTVAAVRKVVEEAAKRAIPADVVAKAVEHALTAPVPKTRYLVGTDAKIRAFIGQILPDRIMDRLLTAVLKLPH
ncbi:Retinol dehydrogenase [Candidatus Nitrospira nitrosa]|uniref:Retinol dehydrogenase n=1 Tax=Candidatus Nitrospira nitrosa TaxID=1742972 RepID=A0A0S4LRY2_9BACT|nr:SDR family oxidoreductase [Candidatus Nitrospira nitrosa]CUS39469.1 Retinol dehydrogenase [Candidatus Nitrospira nitrosa]